MSGTLSLTLSAELNVSVTATLSVMRNSTITFSATLPLTSEPTPVPTQAPAPTPAPTPLPPCQCGNTSIVPMYNLTNPTGACPNNEPRPVTLCGDCTCPDGELPDFSPNVHGAAYCRGVGARATGKACPSPCQCEDGRIPVYSINNPNGTCLPGGTRGPLCPVCECAYNRELLFTEAYPFGVCVNPTTGSTAEPIGLGCPAVVSDASAFPTGPVVGAIFAVLIGLLLVVGIICIVLTRRKRQNKELLERLHNVPVLAHGLREYEMS